ncbi:hypothetical protein ABZ684_22205 [Streptomyces sp. NPDC006995]|uniref:hypothetical protein n=1 Tax=Streptomyces sp. NPDC006995 TaxID=3156907 RepID=UPI00340E3D62
MLDHVVASFDGHHELRAEHAAWADQAPHAVDELAEGAVVVGTVVPRAARPDRVALQGQGFTVQEVVLNDLYVFVGFFELQAIDQSQRVGLAVTREVDVAPVEGDRVAFDGDDAVAGGGEGQDELAVTHADHRDGGARGDTFPQRGEELREEREGVLPQALSLHGGALLASRYP